MTAPLHALLAAALILISGAAPPPQVPLPADLQLPLLARVLSYDRAGTYSGEIVIAVVYQRGLPASVRARDAWQAAARASPDVRVGAARIRVVPVELTSISSLPAALAAAGADVAFLAPMRATDVTAVAAAARSVGTRTAGGGPEHYGVTAVTLVVRDGRPHIVINLPVARSEKSDYSAQLLRLAEVVT